MPNASSRTNASMVKLIPASILCIRDGLPSLLDGGSYTVFIHTLFWNINSRSLLSPVQPLHSFSLTSISPPKKPTHFFKMQFSTLIATLAAAVAVQAQGGPIVTPISLPAPAVASPSSKPPPAPSSNPAPSSAGGYYTVSKFIIRGKSLPNKKKFR